MAISNTPDRTVTPRRVRAKQRPQNVVFNSSVARRAATSSTSSRWATTSRRRARTAFGEVAGYDPVGVSLSGTVTSSSIDARGTTGIARSGLLIRATSASSTTGSIFEPYSLSFSDALTWTKGAHTFKFGGEYRQLQSDFQFLGSTEITYNSITDFIDNRPNAVAVALDSPVFSPQQYYLIGYMQDSWRANDRLTLELGLRYDFYSVVKEKNGNAKPFFIEENNFSTDPDNFYDPDKNNFAPRLSAVYRIDDRTVFRTGFGLFYGPGQFEDRIQPIENAIERRRVGAADVPSNGLAYPVPPAVYLNALSIRGYTHNRPDEYNMQYGASVSRELPGAVNLTVGYTGSRGKDMFLRGVANTLDFNTRARQQPTLRTDRLQDVRMRRRPRHQQPGADGMRPRVLRRAAARRLAPVPLGLHRRRAVSVLEEQRHDAGLERGGDLAEHVRLRDRVRHEPAGHPAHVQRLAGVSHPRARACGAADGAWAAS